MNKKKTRQEKGITLIALIITIVVLLILAVVAIRAVQGDGIIDYAKNARDDYQAKADEEQDMLQNYLNVLNEKTKAETGAGGAEYEAISVETDCVKYYVDIDKESEGPEGIIYIDKAKTVSGAWTPSEDKSYSYTITNVTTGLKEYYISKKSHTTTEFGTAPVLSLIPGSTGEERFYVMALGNVNGGTYTWYNNYLTFYNEGISDYETVTSTGIGAGKTNTETMIAKWNAGEVVTKNDSDVWGIVEEGWYIPSKDEWSAFCSIFGVTSSNYGNLGLSIFYLSSSLNSAKSCWSPWVEFGDFGTAELHMTRYVRLGVTF